MALQSATNGPDDSNSKSKDLDVGTTTCWCVLSIRMVTLLRLSKKFCKKKKKNYSTEYSHVVPHHSTDSAINCLTAQIGRDAVGLVVYGRNSKVSENFLFMYRQKLPF